MNENTRTEKQISTKNIKLLAITAIFTGLTFIATYLLKLDFPLSGGYFNLGESIIYMAAFLFGPIVAAFAGGVGSSLADIAAGYGNWAPGTLIIKAIEGLIVGFIFSKLKKQITEKDTSQNPGKTIKILLLGFVISLLIVILGIHYVPEAIVLWIILSIVLVITIIIGAFYININTFPFVISILFGAVVMVTGYYLYNLYFVYGLAEAIREIPLNILQCLIGTVVSIPVYQAVQKSGILTALNVD